ncbi:MAG: hypothetical protein AAF790_05065, partial [Planctomycetota bacterium]
MGTASAAEAPPAAGQPPRPDAAYQRGDWADAYRGYRQRLVAGQPTGAARNLARAIECLKKLNRIAEFDPLVEAAVRANAGDWRLLAAAARSYKQVKHHGRRAEGVFTRGSGRGSARIVNARQRDRVRSLQLYQRAIAQAEAADERGEAAGVLLEAASAVRATPGGVWRLQALTDLNTLPDYEAGWGYGRRGSAAPVDDAGEPVLHAEPASWAAAASDGQRWRWLLAEATRWDTRLRPEALRRRAEFARGKVSRVWARHLPQEAAAERLDAELA